MVDDGSTDDTAARVDGFAATYPQITIRIQRNPHRGKGGAVQAGMLLAQGEYRFLCDADLAMPIEQVERFLPSARNDFDIAIGSREVTGAHRFNEPAYRHLMGRVFNLVVRLVAVPGIQDTQCGFKCFRAAAAEALFPRQTIDGFAFDVEILYLARRMGLRLVEVPIEWHHDPRSKVSPLQDTARMFWEAVKVRLKKRPGL